MTSLSKLNLYGKGFQIKVLGALLTDKKFLLNARDLLQPDYFDSEAHKWIIETTVKYYDKYHTTISLEALKIELQKVENDILQVAVKSELRNCYEATQEDLAYIIEEFITFCKNQELKTALLNSADLLNQGDFDGIRGLIERAMRAGMDKNMGHEYNKDLESRYRENYRPTIPSPWPSINEITEGGWGPGDLITVFAGPGVGKSWFCVAAAAHAVKLGYNVNYYTLELGEDYVGKRFDCNLSGYGIQEVNQHRSEIEEIVGKLTGRLIVKEYPPKGASINTIKSHIQKCLDMDHKPDFIIIDYVDYLKPPSKSRFTERKDEIDDVFIATKGLAKELGIPILTPSQVNRAGAKDDIIEGDKAAGSYDKIMVSDICISMSRKKEDKILGIGRIHIMKNRYGQDGQTFDAKIDTNNGHIELLGKMSLDFDDNKPAGNYKEISKKFFELENQVPF